ncbi:MAG: response regulator [Elusimicrobiota bacterium]|jgi:CheY-like chemotaxis protein
MPRILVVDDDEDIAQTTAMMLQAGGHEVETELSEKKAMAKIAAFKPDLIVLDVMFPDNSTAGFELAREIRARHKELPVIMVTSVNEHGTPKFGNKDRDPDWLPISEFVEKPVKKDKLLGLVRGLLAKKA